MAGTFFAADFFAADFFAEDFFAGVVVDIGTSITNSQATSDVPVNYELCQRTGFRQYPRELMRDGYGELVRAKSVDQVHPQDFVSSRGGDRQRGSISPEQNDRFIATSIAPEDL